MTNDLKSHVLVHLQSNGSTIGIRTYSRAIGRHGRFLICCDCLKEWLESKRERDFFDMDCGHVLRIRSMGESLQFTFYWLSQWGNTLNGHEQQFCIPAENIRTALNQETVLRYLYIPRCGKAKIELHVRHETMQGIIESPRKRRAFTKAMRDCFNWQDEVVRLYPDWGDSFYFTTRSGFPANGGLILHESTVRSDGSSYRKQYYSVHT